MKQRLYDILNNVDKTSTELNERAEHNVDLRVAMTQKVDKNSVSVQQFKIDVVTHEFAGRNKNFYNIYEHGKLIYEDVALFESAMGIVKNLMIGKTEKVNSINKADIAYNNALYEVNKIKSKAKKIATLQKYDDQSLRRILIWNFDESIQSILPEGPVPYVGYDEQNTYSGTLSTKISQDVRTMHETGNFSLGVSDQQGHTTIRRESKNFYHFVKGGNDSMSNIRRETMFINILQGLHPLEAEILCLVKDKKLTDKYDISQEIVSAAYPDIKWGGRS